MNKILHKPRKLHFLWILILLLFFSLNVYSQNSVTTYCGTGSPGFVNGDTSVASFNKPFGICIDYSGNVYLADAYNHCIRKIGTDGQVSTYAGTGIAGFLDGPATTARFNQPINICFDGEGNMLVSDFINQRIRKISSDMQVTTIAGTGAAGYQNGPADQAKFNYPRGICVDDAGNIFIGDSWNHRIRKISINNIVSDWAGGGTTIGVQSVGDYVDASDTAARFYTPCELSIDQYHNIYVADAYNHRIRKIDASRMVTTHAGSGGFGPNGGGFQNGTADEAQFNVPTACHVITDGTVFVGDGSNQRVRKIATDAIVSTFAGTGETGFGDGPDSLATFDFPRGTVFDYELSRLYVVDYNNHAIRIIHIDQFTNVANHPVINKILLYPNPVKENLFIELDANFSKLQILLYANDGALVRSFSANNEKTVKLDLSDLEPGYYFLQLKNKKKIITSRKVLVIGK